MMKFCWTSVVPLVESLQISKALLHYSYRHDCYIIETTDYSISTYSLLNSPNKLVRTVTLAAALSSIGFE